MDDSDGNGLALTLLGKAQSWRKGCDVLKPFQVQGETFLLSHNRDTGHTLYDRLIRFVR